MAVNNRRYPDVRKFTHGSLLNEPVLKKVEGSMSHKDEAELSQADQYGSMLQRYYDELSKDPRQAGTMSNEELKLRLFLSLIQRPASSNWDSSSSLAAGA